ncbi:MAG: hypothetical protein O2910_01385 [Proteobacteria bacterium]|nr:hypothetical protein [Pseudomonadota bacterium]
MKDGLRTNDEIIAWLAEEFAHPFEGWDFSYLDGRRVPMGTLPWNYVSAVTGHISAVTGHMANASCLLDIDSYWRVRSSAVVLMPLKHMRPMCPLRENALNLLALKYVRNRKIPENLETKRSIS